MLRNLEPFFCFFFLNYIQKINKQIKKKKKKKKRRVPRSSNVKLDKLQGTPQTISYCMQERQYVDNFHFLHSVSGEANRYQGFATSCACEFISTVSRCLGCLNAIKLKSKQLVAYLVSCVSKCLGSLSGSPVNFLPLIFIP